MSITLLLVLVGGAAAWVLVEHLTQRKEVPPTAPPGARAGAAPTPQARFVMLRGMRLIDLRSFPREDLRVGNIDIAREQILLQEVVPVQIWVIDAETCDDWLGLEDVGLVIVCGRLRDRRDHGGKNFLHVIGKRPDEAACRRFEAAGVEVALEMIDLGEPVRELADFLRPPEPWTESPDRRPISPSQIVSTTPFDDYIHIVGDFTFIDLRRAPPAALENGVALGRTEEAVAVLATMPAPKVVVWVLAPWVIARIPADQAPRLVRLLGKLAPSVGHRLAVVAIADEPVRAHPITTALLEAGAAPLQEAYYLRTADRGAFQVPPITALQDTYFYRAWLRPRP